MAKNVRFAAWVRATGIVLFWSVFSFFILKPDYAGAQVTTVFSDDFNSNTDDTWVGTGQIGTTVWVVSRNLADWGARRSLANRLVLSNDISGTANADGWVFASVPIATAFSSEYNTTLSSNTQLITWTFNMRQPRSDPAGFNNGNYGVGFILACNSSTTPPTQGQGYAVLLGNSGTTDPIRLVRFNGGLNNAANITDLITSNTTGLTDFGVDYLSIKVTYNPANNTWELFLRNDGLAGFSDPEVGELVSQGTVVNNSSTGIALGRMGALWQGSTAATQTAFFDNVKVTLGTPALQTTLNTLSTGIANSPLGNSSSNNAVLGFSASSTGTQELQAFTIGTSSTTVGKFTNFKLISSTDNSFTTDADNTEVSGVTISVTASTIAFSGLTQTLNSTAKNYFVVADVTDGVNTSTGAVQFSLTHTNVTLNTGTIGSATITGTNYSFSNPDFILISALKTAVTENFNTLANSSTSSSLPVGWFLSEGGSNANGTYAAGTGSDLGGNTYSFGTTSSSERAFGGLRSGSLIPTIGAKFKNGTGATLTDLTIAYTGEQWRLGTLGREDRLEFQYSTNASSLTTGTWTSVSQLNFVAPVTAGTVGALNGNTAPNNSAVNFTIKGLNIPAGAIFFIRFNDFEADGSDDGLAIDDFSISAASFNVWAATTGNWNIGSNWSKGVFPAGSEDVRIASGTPTLNVDYAHGVGNQLEISGTGSLAIAPGKVLSIAGAADFGNRPVLLQSTNDGTAAIGQVSGTLQNATQVTVERFIPQALTTSGRSWRLLSLPVSGTATIRDAWAGGTADRVSSHSPSVFPSQTPGRGTLITGHNYKDALTANADGFDFWEALTNGVQGASSSIRRYSSTATAGSWTSNRFVNDVMSTPLSAANQAYMVFIRGDRTVTNGAGSTTLAPTGTLRTGAVPVAVPANTTAKFFTYGNPYAATIDFGALYADNAAVIKEVMYIWDADLPGSNGLGGYRTVTRVGGQWQDNVTGSPVAGIQLIHSSQGVILESNTETGGTLTTQENHKTTNEPAVNPFNIEGNEISQLNVQLYQGSNTGQFGLIDGTTAVFGTDYSASLSDRLDIRKMENFTGSLGIALRNGTTALSFEGRPSVKDGEIMPLQLTGLGIQQYSLRIEPRAMQSPGRKAWLVDTYTGTQTAINLEGSATTYTFNGTSDIASRNAGRFHILFAQPAVNNITLRATMAAPAKVQLNWTVDAEAGVTHYRVERSRDGTSFTAIRTERALGQSPGQYSWIHDNSEGGLHYYRISASNSEGKTIYSNTAIIAPRNGISSISAFPTVLTAASQIMLQVKDAPAGIYRAEITDAFGRVISTQNLRHNGMDAGYRIPVPAGLLPGVYQIRFSGNGIIHTAGLVKG